MFRNLLILFSLIVLTACSKFETAEFGPGIPIVYAILDHNDTVHYVRINKTFNGNVPTHEMASNPDSLLFTFPLKVSVFVLDKDDKTVTTLSFAKEKMLKDSVNEDGNVVFAVNEHFVYVFRGELPMGKDYSYYLEIKGTDDKLIASSYTNSMWNFIFAVPKVNSMIHLQKGYHISTAWNTGNYAGLVKSDLTVYYYEHNSKEKKYYIREISFTSPMMKAKAGGFGYDCNYIIEKIVNQIEKNDSPDIDRRYIGRMSIKYYAANNDLAEYILFKEGTGTINSGMSTVSPITNISGGFGIFGARAIGTVEPVFFTFNTRNGFAILKNENGDRYKFPSQMFYYDLPDTLPWRYVE